MVWRRTSRSLRSTAVKTTSGGHATRPIAHGSGGFKVPEGDGSGGFKVPEGGGSGGFKVPEGGGSGCFLIVALPSSGYPQKLTDIESIFIRVDFNHFNFSL